MDFASKVDPAHGRVDASSPAALKRAAGQAFKDGDLARAGHLYTLAIDVVLGEAVPAAAAAAAAADATPAQAEAPAAAAAAGRDWLALERASDGVLHVLLSNRALCHFKADDFAASATDAEHCVAACPTFEKGHLRLLTALTAAGDVGVPERRRVITRGLRCCPDSKALRAARAALDKEAGPSVTAALDAEEAASLAEQLRLTRKVADDPRHPQHAVACGDLGAALAVGAHGVEKDLEAAERYLRAGSDAGDVASAKNLGMLYLQLERFAEASAQLRRAADGGDAQAGEVLQQMGQEATKKREEAMFKLRALAARGDERAAAMLAQFAAAENKEAESARAAAQGRP